MSTVVTGDVAREFASALAERLGEELVRVALFGSRARGDARRRSDYDLMVVVRTATGEARSAVHGLATRFELDGNVDLSTKIVDAERFEELRRSSLPFWRNYMRDERVLWPPTSSPSA
ncbi:MAG TPA: nucleotidyltransferase domain-containing protein [Thermoanaerobaculia bacterium]|nr:nucleotidyltransferase domain-containing protein [Thermoanaerobaculia bacterium]